MNLQPGNILISAPSLDDPNFEKVVIVIAAYNEKGALGFVINQLFSRRLNELVEFQHARPFALYDGGPVEREGLYVLHQRPDIIRNSELLFGNTYMGGNFKDVIYQINQNVLHPGLLKLLIGYCGWDPGQLEAEIIEGSWLLTDAAHDLIFEYPAETTWKTLYEKYF
jgi:putative transcriptional regulator